MNKKLFIVIVFAFALLGLSHQSHAEELVDENGVPLVNMRGGIGAEVRAELGDNATIGERLRLQRERVRATIETKRGELHDRIEDGRAVIKAEIDARKGVAQERKAEVRATVEARLIEKLENRYNAALERLTTLASRIEARMNILKQQGKDVSQATTELAAARASIATAQTHIDAFLALGVSAEFSSYRTEAEAILKALKEAKKHLQETVRLLKGLSMSAEAEGSVTVQ